MHISFTVIHLSMEKMNNDRKNVMMRSLQQAQGTKENPNCNTLQSSPTTATERNTPNYGTVEAFSTAPKQLNLNFI